MYLPNSQVNPGSLHSMNPLGSAAVTPESVDVSVHVTDPKNASIGQVEIAIDDVSCTTGNAGGCTLRDITVGEHIITATKTGYTEYSQEVNITTETETVEITLEPEER